MTQTLQELIIENLHVKQEINPAEEIRTRVDFLKNYLKNSGQLGFCLGISGGQDSALTGALGARAVRELNEEVGSEVYKFLALLLPYGQQKDADEAAYVAEKFIEGAEVINFNIKDTVDAFENTFNRNTLKNQNGVPKLLEDFQKGNTKARIRMSVQYAYAGSERLLVLGCAHASESINGYETKGGDNMYDLTPLTGLNKRQGKQLLRLLDAPDFLFTKNPTADLLDNAPQQADETELGQTYEEIDDFLENKEIRPEAAQQLEKRFILMEHKRQLPVTPYDSWVEDNKKMQAGLLSSL